MVDAPWWSGTGRPVNDANRWLGDHQPDDASVAGMIGETFSRNFLDPLPILLEKLHGFFACRHICDHATGEATYTIRDLKVDRVPLGFGMRCDAKNLTTHK